MWLGDRGAAHNCRLHRTGDENVRRLAASSQTDIARGAIVAQNADFAAPAKKSLTSWFEPL
jgi:hypothetical protein